MTPRRHLCARVRCPDSACAARDTVRGQYEGYLNEPGVASGSKTETYVAFKVHVATPRWQGVPFYLRSGKRLAAKDVEISVHFKKPPCGEQACFFRPETVKRNVLVFRIQPHEGIALRLMAKQPGFGMTMAPVIMQWDYAMSFSQDKPDAYERLLVDAVKGDQTLFARTDALLASWKLVTDILDGWASANVPVHTYAPGSMGPGAADDLLAADGRAWYLHRES